MEEAVKNTLLVVTLLHDQSQGFFNKPQEIIADSNRSDNLPGFQNSRLNVHDDITPGRKGKQSSRLVAACLLLKVSSKFYRSVRVLESSHLASPAPLTPLAVRYDKGPTNEPGVLRYL